MNQILYELSSLCRWSSAGALNAFDSDFSTAVGGYPLGAVLISDDGATIYISTINNNTNDPNTSSAGWSPLSDYLKMRESFTGVVGQAVNQKMSVAIASASATFTAD
ncbi:TPA: hypothetical protein ACIF6B_005151, partial [Escherichia coli]